MESNLKKTEQKVHDASHPPQLIFCYNKHNMLCQRGKFHLTEQQQQHTSHFLLLQFSTSVLDFVFGMSVCVLWYQYIWDESNSLNNNIVSGIVYKNDEQILGKRKNVMPTNTIDLICR